MTELLQYQIQYAAWANARALEAALQLTPVELDRDFGSSEKSVRGTLVHIYRSERLWISRITGSPVAFSVPGDDTMEALAQNWPGVGEQWRHFASKIEPEMELTYQDLRGNAWTQLIWRIVLHAVNHSTHHRGQAIGFMRAMGHAPPNTDSITFARLG